MKNTKSIWKFTLPKIGLQEIQMPKDAKILSAAVQGSVVCIWAEVIPSAPLESRSFEVFGTGFEMRDAERAFIGTIQIQGGTYILHVFEQL